MAKELYLPALRCHMGDWVYYSASLKLREAADRIKYAKEVNKSEVLDEILQRSLKPRSKDIAEYLIHQDQRLFSSLVVAVYEGDPEWFELDISPSKFFRQADLPEEDQERMQDTLGFLRLTGAEKLFALDGQHRLAGIIEAIQSNETLGDEELIAIFVGHKTSSSGVERTRRLFTTLNRHAKPVSIYERIALDEDDASAILTRRLLREHELLKGKRVAAARSALPATDQQSLTTVVIVYRICQLVLTNQKINDTKWTKKKLDSLRPEVEDLDALYSKVSAFWTKLSKQVAAIRSYQKAKDEPGSAEKYRTPTGGHVLFRPVGLHAFGEAYREMISAGHDSNQALSKLAKANFDLGSEFWRGVLWNKEAGKMLAQGKNRVLAQMMFLYQIGQLDDKEEFHERYRKVTDRPDALLPDLS